MSGKIKLYSLLVLMAVFLGFLRYKAAHTPAPSASPVPSPSPADVAGSETSEWKQLDGATFSLEYPPEASVSASEEGPDSHSWRITYVGEQQKKSGRDQTELLDGYSLTITRFENPTDTIDLQINSDSKGLINACGNDSLSAVSEVSISAYKAKYLKGECYGTYENYYLKSGKYLYRFTTTFAQPSGTKLDYRGKIKKILDSFKLIPS